MAHTNRNLRLPVAPFATKLSEHLDPFKDDEELMSGALDYLEAHGVGRRLVHRLQTGATKTILFETADTLLCALGRVEDWHIDPELSCLYQAADLT